MKIKDRQLNILHLLKINSFFLFGPRGVGKSYWIRNQLKPKLYYDLLEPITFTRFIENPALLEEEIQFLNPQDLVVIDEIQKIPALLNSVHRMIELKKINFLLTGSSARKLKRDPNVNLLGGRAWDARFYPLSYSELESFNLLTYLNRGGLPRALLNSHFHEEHKSYVGVYLKEEILAEALTRNLGHFSRFLEVAALQSGEELSYENIGSDAQVQAKTVKNYVEILEDTLLGFQLPAFWKTKKRKAITRSKFYLFDIGITNYLAKRGEIKKGSELFGKAFEHFIILEIRAYLSYRRKDLELFYWRSVNNQEVDLIIGDQLAIEIKATFQVSEKHLKGLNALAEEKLVKEYIVVSQDPRMRKLSGLTIYPWQIFLDKLWRNEIII